MNVYNEDIVEPCFKSCQRFRMEKLRTVINKSGKVCSLECTDIPRVLFTPHHGRRSHEVVLLITTAQRNCGLKSFLQGCSNDIKAKMTSKVIVTMCPQVILVSQQLPRFQLL